MSVSVGSNVLKVSWMVPGELLPLPVLQRWKLPLFQDPHVVLLLSRVVQWFSSGLKSNRRSLRSVKDMIRGGEQLLCIYWHVSLMYELVLETRAAASSRLKSRGTSFISDGGASVSLEWTAGTSGKECLMLEVYPCFRGTYDPVKAEIKKKKMIGFLVIWVI